MRTHTFLYKLVAVAESKRLKTLLYQLVLAPNSVARRVLDAVSDAGSPWSIPVPDASGPAKESARGASCFPHPDAALEATAVSCSPVTPTWPLPDRGLQRGL